MNTGDCATREEIEYARQDVRCTAGLLNALKQEFDKHPIDLRPWSAYSPASVAKSYLAALGIVPPAKKFDVPHEIQGIAMQSYFGGRSETKIRCAEVPVCPLDFTSSYPSRCALLGLFDVLTAESVNFKDDTEDVHRLLKRISHNGCFNRDLWKQFTFWALVLPDDDILPVRTVYDGVTQNIGNNYLTSEVPIWIAGPDLIASAIRTRKAPRVIRAIRMVPSGKQAGMQSVKLRGLVEIDPYRDDLFRKIIEDRKKNKSNDALYYWLKILANSIYGFFVELNPETQSEPVPVTVFSGEKRFPDVTDTLEKPGAWFFAPLASLITSGGRLLLALAEECVTEARGTWMAADTDSIMVVSSKKGRQLRIPGSEGLRILSWDETQAIAERFAALNPYDPSIVKQNSILNLTDENFVDPKAEVRVQRQLYGYSIAAKRYALYERLGRNDIKIVDAKGHGIGYLYPPKDSPDGWGKDHDVPQWIWEMWEYIVRGALGLKRRIPAWAHLPQMMRVSVTTYNVLKMLHEWKGFRPYNFLFMPMIDPVFGHHFYVQPNEKVLLVTPFSAKQDEWFDLQPMNAHTGGKYRMADLSDPSDIDCMPGLVFPQTFGLLVRRYQEHPESKSLAPDGSPCKAKTRGVLRRAHIVAGDLRCVGKETDRKWEDGDDLSVTEFAVVEYGRAKKVTDTSLGAEIRKIGIRKTMKLTKMSQHTIEKLVRGEAVKRGTHERVLKAIHAYRSKT